MATHTASDEITALSLFTGAGMLDVAVELAFGPIFRPIAYVECEAYAAAVLAAAMGQGRIHPAPIWSDARTVCRPQFRHYVRTCLGAERLGAVIAGYPCPDFSVAGKREGTRGAKGSLWWNLAEAIAEFEPQLLFLENVGGHTSRGFDTVCSALQEMGYRVAGGLFTASETGASHRRERLFIMAYLDEGRRPRVQKPDPLSRVRIEPPRRCDAQRRSAELENADRPHESGDMGDAECSQRRPGDERRGCIVEGGDGERKTTSSTRSPDKTMGGAPGDNRGRGIGPAETGARPRRFRWWRSSGPIAELADADGPGLRTSRIEGQGLPDTEHGRKPGPEEPGIQEGPATPEFHQAQLPEFPPGPGDIDAWRKILEIDPTLEPAICGMANGMAERTRRLRLSGNGVVPLEAAYAYITLAADLFDAGC